MPVLELHGRLSGSGEILGLCVWCDKPADSAFLATGINRELPLHALCAARLIRAYEDWLQGRRLHESQVPGVTRYLHAVAQEVNRRRDSAVVRVNVTLLQAPTEMVRDLLALGEGTDVSDPAT